MHNFNEGDNNKEHSFKTVLLSDLPLQDGCLQQTAPSCHNKLKQFAHIYGSIFSISRIVSL